MTSAARQETTFVATPEKGEVSGLLLRPPAPSHLLVIGHGYGSSMRHATLEAIAQRMADFGVATFRYNFPYRERGAGRDSQEVCTATVRAAVAAAHRLAGDLPLLAGGHSFGGRMTSIAASETPLADVRGLVLFSFPLHQPGKPDTKRAAHLGAVTVPMLFLSGGRDALARLELLRPVCDGLGGQARLHVLDSADHAFRTLKRSRNTPENVFEEMARITKEWASRLS